MRRNKCQICDCQLYDDEPGGYCADCRTICQGLYLLHLHDMLDTKKFTGTVHEERQARLRRYHLRTLFRLPLYA